MASSKDKIKILTEARNQVDDALKRTLEAETRLGRTSNEDRKKLHQKIGKALTQYYYVDAEIQNEKLTSTKKK